MSAALLGQRGGRQRTDRDCRLRGVAAAAVRRDADDLHERVAAGLRAASVGGCPGLVLLRHRPDPVRLDAVGLGHGERVGQGCAAEGGVELRGGGVERLERPRRRSPDRSPESCRRAWHRQPRPPRRARAAQSASASSSTALVAARPTFPRSGTAISIVTSSIPVDWVGPARGEAQHQRALTGHERERARPGVPGGALRDLKGVHATPTSTSRKRAGAVPWDTRITWPGSPFPQSSREISRQLARRSRRRRSCPRTPASRPA